MKVLMLLGGFLAMVLAFVSCGIQSATSHVKDEAGQSFYTTNVGPNVAKDCKVCHELRVPDYATAKSMIVPGKVDDSQLYQIASGQNDHPTVWQPDSAQMMALKKWIAMEK